MTRYIYLEHTNEPISWNTFGQTYLIPPVRLDPVSRVMADMILICRSWTGNKKWCDSCPSVRGGAEIPLNRIVV